jgi:16S rRNA (cytosine967-C5)-methyltransferase
VYATCSLLNEENDFIVEQFLSNHPDFELVPMKDVLAEQKIPLEMDQYLKMLPHKHQTDGFFAAVMQRKAKAKAAESAEAVDEAGDEEA